jgi:23S rRNA (cytosine1962-C5)-methyltransferase
VTPARLVLRPGHDLRVRGGHPWVYRTEVARLEGAWRPEDAVTVTDAAGRVLGRGLYSPRPRIACRLLTWHDEPVDRDFFRRRLEAAWRHRQALAYDGDAGRLAFSEGDRLPGLVVDRFGEVLVLQALTLGMARLAPALAGLAADVAGARAVYRRDEPAAGAIEGLDPAAGWLRGEGPEEVEIREGPCRFRVAVATGQKTGFYLDQRENRAAVAGRAAGREVLDAFCYTGAFGAQALAAGAARVLGLEASADAAARARAHLLAHAGGDAARVEVREANAFDALRDLQREGRRFDLVVLDPPPFTRRRTAVDAARRGYKEVNLRALACLRPGGVLATFSCSHHVGPALFEEICRDAAADARRPVRVAALLGQARDHPVLLAVPETRYLTGLLLEVLE